MSLDREDYITRVKALIQDHAEFLQPDDVDRFLDESALLYSKDRPRIQVCEITGDASTYEWSVGSGNTILTDWVEGFSFIKGRVEYPAHTSTNEQQVPVYVDDNFYMFYRKSVSDVAVLYLKTTGFTPSSGKVMRFEYTIPHSLTDTANSIKDGDSSAVINLTASLCFWALAAKLAQSTEPTIDADSVDHQRKSEQYLEMAKERADMYKALMGIGEDSTAKASAGVAIKDLDIRFPGSIGDYLTHPAHTR